MIFVIFKNDFFSGMFIIIQKTSLMGGITRVILMLSCLSYNETIVTLYLISNESMTL